MTTWMFLLLLLTTVVYVVIAPLWNRRADEPLGRGIETDDIAERWHEEKDRLVAEQRSLDMALAEGEIDKEEHTKERAILQHDANRALDHLRQARRADISKSAVSLPGTHPKIGTTLAITIVAFTCGIAYVLSLQDLQRDVSPHADGRMPLPATTASAQNPTVNSKGGPPDIAAMVARLEARVNARGNDVVTPDLLMLGRSYRVMGRKEDAVKTYRRVLSVEPSNLAAAMAVGSILLNSEDKAKRDEADQLIDRALAIRPNFPEALWLRTLAFVRDHKIEKAKRTLNRLTPMVQDNPQAKTAVDNLLSQLDQTLSTAPARAK